MGVIYLLTNLVTGRYYIGQTVDQRARMTAKMIGRKLPPVSDEARKKMSESQKRNPNRYWLGKKRDWRGYAIPSF